jgi:hypothetical protein
MIVASWIRVYRCPNSNDKEKDKMRRATSSSS